MKIRVMAVVLAAFSFFSCDQYPIFHAISQEVKPKDPRVKGSPTNMVELDGTMYVASRFGRTIHCYNEEGAWNRTPSPAGGSVMELATDGKSLYALVGDPLSGTNVYRKDGAADAEWAPVPFNAGGVIQTIRGAGDGDEGYIFASTDNGLFFHKTDGSGNGGFSPLLTGLSKENIVTDAAYVGDLSSRTYYVAVVNKGVYTFDGTETPWSEENPPVEGTAGKPIVGMLAVGDTIVAVSRERDSGNGSLFYSDSSGFSEESKGVAFSGAMGIWRNPNNLTQHLLLVGIQASSRSTINGYREILLNADGSLNIDSLALRSPGVDSDVSTVSSADRYTSTMGLRVATSLYQAKDGVLFASTSTHGLWSYKNDVWNAEE